MIKKVDTLSNRLSYAMKMQNVGVCELERSSGVAKGLISRYINGLKFPKDNNITRREDKKRRTVKNYEGIVKKERCGLDCVRR